MADSGAYREMTPKAVEAYADYVALGPDRSLDALAKKYQASTEPVPTTQLSRLKVWSTKYHWQQRLVSAVSEHVDARLALSAEYDSMTFLAMSKELHSRSKYTTRENLDAIIKIRESVRKPVAKVGATINVNLNLIVKELAEKYGLTEDEARELHDDVTGHLAASKVAN